METEIGYDLGRLAMTMGHLGVLMLFARSSVLTWLRTSLAAVGRMAFTNYILHSIICAFVFYGFGLGLSVSSGGMSSTTSSVRSGWPS
jgi:uncharacterized protein